MRLEKYMINEKRGLSEFFPKFSKDCKIFISDWMKSKADTFFYRNTRNVIKTYDVMVSHLRDGRIPTDTPQYLHKTLNHWFHKQFGWDVRNGVFVSGKILDAYGSPSLFFPIGKYEFVWSDEIEDLYKEMDDKSLIENEPNYDTISEWEDEWAEKFSDTSGNGHWELDGEYVGNDNSDIDDFLDDLKDRDIEKWRDTSKNDFEWVPDMSMDDYVNIKTEDYIEDFDNKLENFLDNCDYEKGGISRAIDSGNEVIFKCNKYYLINTKYEQSLYKIFKEIRRDPKQLTLFDITDYL